jgi:hypothetical protein
MPEILGPKNEKTNCRYTATLTDELGAAIDGTALDQALLTLTDVATGTTINSRSAQDVKNANNVTISAGGALVWALQPADMAIVSTTLATGQIEDHRALWVLTWGGAGVKQCRHDVILQVRNLSGVT